MDWWSRAEGTQVEPFPGEDCREDCKGALQPLRRACVCTGRVGQGCGSRLLNRGSSIPIVQFADKKGSTLVQGRSQTQEGDTWKFREQPRCDNPTASEQSRRPPPSGRFGYYLENAVESLALRHLGANELSGRLADFFYPLVALAVNQSFTRLLLEVASVILCKPRIICFRLRPSLTPLARLCV